MDNSNPFTAWSIAPFFSQPILPGWTINVDSNNSASPRTEGVVVSKFSYGRQLGQISDALAAIIATLPAKAKSESAVAGFLKMKAAIDVLKDANLGDRVASLASELSAMKHSDKPAFDKLSAPLRDVL